MPKLPAPLPSRLAPNVPGSPTDPGGGTGGGTDGGGGGGSIYSPQGREVDVAIAGIPFMLATSNDLPKSVETVPVHKDQLDIEQDPGEQSLSWWWRRSQASFHGGEGLLYQEASDTTAAAIGYYKGSGIDVFTQGRVTLLKRMIQLDPDSTYTRLRTTRLNNSLVSWVTSVVGGKMCAGVQDDNWTTDSIFSTDQLLYGPEGPPTVSNVVDAMAVASQDFMYVTADGTLYYHENNIMRSYPLGGISPSPTRLGWGKGRLWVIGGPYIWQPDVKATDTAEQEPVYSNPNPGWNYTCMAEGPGAMYFGGHDGNTSSIQAVTFDASGGIPTLSGAAVTAALPQGELVQELTILAGTYFGIGTNRGFRIGQVDVYNNAIDYGPILFNVEGINSCTALVAQSRFFVVAFDTTDQKAVAYRVDTSVPLDNQQFPYAHDIDCGTGAITSMAVTPDGKRLLATTNEGGLWIQSLTRYVDNGYLQTGRIRFRTTELKAFKYVSYEAEPLQGSILVEGNQEGGGTLAIGTQTTQGSMFTSQYAINPGAARYFGLTISLTPTEDTLSAPVFNSYLLKALPAVKPQRLITLPLACYDYEQARSGQQYGGDGYAAQRLAQLQAIEDRGDVVTFQDFSAVQGGGRAVVIDSMKYVELVPSPRYKASASGPGGILQVQLRTVD